MSAPLNLRRTTAAVVAVSAALMVNSFSRSDASEDHGLRMLPAGLSEDPRTDSAAVATVDSVARARQDSTNRAHPRYVVDSILPIEEELRRFRAMVGGPRSGFEGGARSLDALARDFVSAVDRADTAALSRLKLSAREFAWLVYPTSPFTRPPYRQAPGLVWMSIDTPSHAGRVKLLQRYSGHSLGAAGLLCDHPVERQGVNRLYAGCLLELTDEDGAIIRRRLFGTIIERHGVFKIVSFDNDL